ncbi:MAG: polysaccharide pyruvyl transferase family protein [Lachnospiraceae bacterium]
MKAGIVTFVDYTNYGNRLQNYAVSEIFQSLGYETYTIDMYQISNPLKRILKVIMQDNMYLVYLKFRQLLDKNLERERKVRFIEFTHAFMKKKNIVYNKELPFNLQDKFDYFLAGSDQIWNPYFGGNPEYFLTFVPKEKRIACIASIGVIELPDAVKTNYKEWISQMHYISVREESAAKLIKDLTGREVESFLDPTLLLERKEWEKLSKKPKVKIPERYILTFFLGEEPQKWIEHYAQNDTLSVISMEHKDCPEYYVFDPAEFLYLISHAERILTDSFHAAAFSLKFRKQVNVFRRQQKSHKDMFTRIDNLLTKFGIQDCYREWEYQESNAMEEKGISKEQFDQMEQEMKKERKRFENSMKRELNNEIEQVK